MRFSTMFAYAEAEIAAMVGCLTGDRLSSYLRVAKGDRALALRLYAYNAEVSASFYMPLQTLEVTLRNALADRLDRGFGPNWHGAPAFLHLSPRILQSIADAQSQLSAEGKAIDTPHTIAALPFGFWVALLGNGHGVYETKLWRPHLRKAFPNAPGLVRKRCHGPLDSLRRLRNRIAHHEPILHGNLIADYQSILTVAGWLNGTAASWIDHHANCLSVIARRPVSERVSGSTA